MQCPVSHILEPSQKATDMSKKILTLLPVLAMLFSQCIPTTYLPQGERYKDLVSQGNKMVSGGANFIVERTPDNHFVLKRFYYETRQITAEQTYADRNLSILDGPNKQWLDDGRIWTDGVYKKGEKTGTWKEYSTVGTQKRGVNIGEYLNGEKTGYWVHWDSLGVKERESKYEKGEQVSYKTFYPDGTVKLDTILGEPDLDELMVQTVPNFPCDPKFADLGKDCNERSLLTYLANNVKYPQSARDRNITGMAIMQFVVDKEGNVVHVEVLQGICDDIKAECKRVVNGMPKWTPGMADGKPVKVRYTLPIRFKLE
jgi:TonB family protein